MSQFGGFSHRALLGGGVDPARDFGCLVYVDADTGVTLNGSSKVTNIVDQSGNGNHLNAAGGGFFMTVAAWRNGRNAFQNDGDIYRATLTGGNRASPYTMMFCGTWPNSTDGNGCVPGYPAPSSSLAVPAYQNFNFGPFRVRMVGTVSQVLFDTTSTVSGVNKPPQGSAFVYTCVFNGASSTVWIWSDGNLKKFATVAGDIGSQAATGFYISPNGFTKPIAAAALYAGAMSLADQESLLTTMCDRYAISVGVPIDPTTVSGLLVDLSGTAVGNTTSAGRFTSMANAGSYGQNFAEVSSNGPTVNTAGFPSSAASAPFFPNGKYLAWPHVTPTQYPFGNMHDLSEAYLCFRVFQDTLNPSYALYLSTMVGNPTDRGFHLKYSPTGQLMLDVCNGSALNSGVSAAGVIQSGKQYTIEVIKHIVGGTQIALDGYVNGVQVITGTPFTPTALAQTSATYFGNYVGSTTLYSNAVIGRALNYNNIPSATTRAGIRTYVQNQYY